MFDIQNPGVVISFLLVFVQFVAFFECFVFMALSVRIKIPYIEKSATSARAFTDTFPLKSTEAHGSETKSFLIIDLIVNINLDYLKKTVHNQLTTNIQGGILKQVLRNF